MSRFKVPDSYYAKLSFSGPVLFGAWVKLQGSPIANISYSSQVGGNRPLLTQRLVVVDGDMTVGSNLDLDSPDVKRIDVRGNFGQPVMRYNISSGVLTIIPMHAEGGRWVSSNWFTHGFRRELPGTFEVSYEDSPLSESAREGRDSLCRVSGELSRLNQPDLPDEEAKNPEIPDDDRRPR